jgi:hypothetical protein
MAFEVIATVPFERKYKRLAKKYKSLANDLAPIVKQLSENPVLGTSIGKDCYKIRVPISSKGMGKSGGARLITYVRFINNRVFLMDIYDKSEQVNISEKELKFLIDILSQ